MNLANKLTMFRIFLSILIITILLFPFYEINVNIPKAIILNIAVDFKYILCAFIFIIASLTDALDGYIARSRNMVTDFGKLIDAIADKMLVDSVLIILCAQGFISPVITVIVILRDTFVDAIKMMAASKGKVVAAIKTGKVKTALLMFGVILTLCYNLPFEYFNIDVANFILILATIFSVVSGVQYYILNKKIIFEN